MTEDEQGSQTEEQDTPEEEILDELPQDDLTEGQDEPDEEVEDHDEDRMVLREANEAYLDALARWTQLAERTKVAKQRREAAQDDLNKAIAEFLAPMPLFEEPPEEAEQPEEPDAAAGQVPDEPPAE